MDYFKALDISYKLKLELLKISSYLNKYKDDPDKDKVFIGHDGKYYNLVPGNIVYDKYIENQKKYFQINEFISSVKNIEKFLEEQK